MDEGTQLLQRMASRARKRKSRAKLAAIRRALAPPPQDTLPAEAITVLKQTLGAQCEKCCRPEEKVGPLTPVPSNRSLPLSISNARFLCSRCLCQ